MTTTLNSDQIIQQLATIQATLALGQTLFVVIGLGGLVLCLCALILSRK